MQQGEKSRTPSQQSFETPPLSSQSPLPTSVAHSLPPRPVDAFEQGIGSRAFSGTDDEPVFDDDDEKADLLSGMPPPADPTFAEQARSWSWLWGVGVFAIFMVGAVLLFWDEMHVKKVSGRPEVGETKRTRTTT